MRATFCAERRLAISVVIALVSIGNTQAAQLLGSWQIPSTEVIDPGLIDGVSLWFAVGPDADTFYAEGPGLFGDAIFRNGDVGAIASADINSDIDFAAITSVLTNGVDDQTFMDLVLRNGVSPGSTYGAGSYTESQWAAQPGSTSPADFTGYTIERIDVVVEAISLVFPVTSPGGNDNWTAVTLDTRIDFYGSIPEPSSGLLAAFILICICRVRLGR